MLNLNKINKIKNLNRQDLGKVWIFTNARDESNIAEWVAHYLLLGFDHAIIFDHLSVNPIKDQLHNKFQNKVTVFPITGQVQHQRGIKVDLMFNALSIARKNGVNWFLYVDADEYLVLNSHNHIKEYLKLFSFADAIGINWLYFGSNHHDQQPKGLLMDNFIKSEPRLNHHVKTFVRPICVKNIINPHFYNLYNPNRYYTGNGRRMKEGPFNEEPVPFFKSMIYLAHYYSQSKEEFMRRKQRIQDDGTTKVFDVPNFHELFNNVVNKQVQNKYAQGVKVVLERNNLLTDI